MELAGQAGGPIALTRTAAKAKWDQVQSPAGFSFLLEHDLFRKLVSTFRDHALGSVTPSIIPDWRDAKGLESPVQAPKLVSSGRRQPLIAGSSAWRRLDHAPFLPACFP
jgi:hypothetical protein